MVMRQTTLTARATVDGAVNASEKVVISEHRIAAAESDVVLRYLPQWRRPDA
jgi:hypothetical protein